MIAGTIVFSVLLTLVWAEFFIPPKPKTSEEKLGEALANYLKEGVKVKQDGK